VLHLAHAAQGGADAQVKSFIGEVTLPLKALLIRDAVIKDGGEIVGWFPLADPHGHCGDEACTGQLKLGLRLVGAELLGGVEGLGTVSFSDSTSFEEDYAVLH